MCNNTLSALVSLSLSLFFGQKPETYIHTYIHTYRRVFDDDPREAATNIEIRFFISCFDVLFFLMKGKSSRRDAKDCAEE